MSYTPTFLIDHETFWDFIEKYNVTDKWNLRNTIVKDLEKTESILIKKIDKTKKSYDKATRKIRVQVNKIEGLTENERTKIYWKRIKDKLSKKNKEIENKEAVFEEKINDHDLMIIHRLIEHWDRDDFYEINGNKFVITTTEFSSQTYALINILKENKIAYSTD